MPPVPPPNSAIAELAEALGEESARELVEMFLNSFDAVLRDLNAGDREQRNRAAHSLKSSSRIVGAGVLSNRMAELEARLTNTTGDVTHDDITATIEEFERIAVALRAYARQTGA
jgi:HPt (histidine-containing phosphotransfer) domain-containing protein